LWEARERNLLSVDFLLAFKCGLPYDVEKATVEQFANTIKRILDKGDHCRYDCQTQLFAVVSDICDQLELPPAIEAHFVPPLEGQQSKRQKLE
jgi:hypothetical protein